MCFQNLLLGGPVIVVLAKHSPWKCRLFTSRGCVSGGWVGGGGIYTKENWCWKHFPVFIFEPVELNNNVFVQVK